MSFYKQRNICYTWLEILCLYCTALRSYLFFTGYDLTSYRGEAYTRFWCGNLRERDHLGDPDVDRTIILKWIFRKYDVGVWAGSSCLRIGTGGGNL